MERLDFDLTTSLPRRATTPMDVKPKAGRKYHKHNDRSSYRASDVSDIMVALVDPNLTRE
jgi:hypothetical protein